MNRLFRLADAALVPLAVVGEAAVALMCLHIVVEIVANSFFQSPIEGTTEVVARWYMVALVFLPLAIIQRGNGHIKAEIFTDGLPPRALALLEAVINLLMTAMAAFFAWYSGLDAIEATTRRESLELMRGTLIVWPTRWFVPIGFAALMLVSLISAMRGFLSLGASRHAERGGA